MPDMSMSILLVFLFGLGTCLAWALPVRGNISGTSFNSVYAISQDAPFSIWIEKDNAVIWQNRFCARHFADGSTPFAGRSEFKTTNSGKSENGATVFDLKKERPNTASSYSIHTHQRGASTVYYAHDATALIETENELKRFVQTLAATFAHLPIGLAVFDKKRDLTLFNPALSDLLGLAPDWLARQPSMRAFLDRLRNEGAIPEPKDFTAVRHEFAELESGAFTGTYEVDWALPSGHIYRVTGRPHSQGGAALLFEDISKAAALESSYRAELGQLYSALESLTDAVAIFDQAGELAYANDVFDDLWECSLSSSVTPTTVNDVTRYFQKHSLPTPVWGEFRNFVHDLSERSQWQAVVHLKSGATLEMTVSPIADGRVFCQFHETTSAESGDVLGVGKRAV